MAGTAYVGWLFGYVSDSGFLVTYSGAKVGFAFRELRANYSGYLVLCRRTSDNVEQGFYQGATVGTLNTVRGGGGTSIESWASGTNAAVKTWYDQSGNSIDLTQTTASSQPLIVSGGTLYTEGGLPCMLFDGSDDYLTLSSTISSDTFTSFMITKRTSSFGKGVALMTDESSGRGYTPFRYSDNYLYVHNYAGVVYSPLNGSATSLELLTGYMDGTSISNSKLLVNGTEITGGDRGQITQTGATTLKHLGYRSSASDYSAGKCSELLLWESLNASYASINTDLKTVYGL